jgi:hypothetical protein
VSRRLGGPLIHKRKWRNATTVTRNSEGPSYLRAKNRQYPQAELITDCRPIDKTTGLRVPVKLRLVMWAQDALSRFTVRIASARRWDTPAAYKKESSFSFRADVKRGSDLEPETS